MKPLYRYSIVAIICVVVTLLFVKSCAKETPATQKVSTPLSNGEVLKVGVGDHKITVETQKDTITKYLPSEGQANVIVDKTGKVDVQIKEVGLTLRPVFGVMASSNLDLAMGWQVGYWNRYELYGGMTVPHLGVFGAIGYRLDQIKWLENTSAFVSYDTNRQIGAGLLWRF